MLTEPTCLLSIFRQLILLALAEIRSHFVKSSKNTKRIAIFLHSLPTVIYLLPRGKTLFHLPRINLLVIFKDISSTTQKYPKTFHQQPENFQGLLRLKNCLSCKSSISRKHSKTFRPAATSRSDQQQPSTAATSRSNQHQPSTAATSKSNQQQPSTIATSKSNQHQPSTAATSKSNQQQPSTAATSKTNQQQPSTAATSKSNQQQPSTAATGINNQHLLYQQLL